MKTDHWAHDVLKYDTVATLFAHWNTFSLFTCHYPISGYLYKLFLVCVMYFYPTKLLGFILGHEVGAFLLPISHDWVHDRKCAIFGIKYLLQFLHNLGIFATRHDHKKHHNHDHPYVYQNFTSSGIYSQRFDKCFDSLWNYLFDCSSKRKIQLYKLMWYPMFATFLGTVLLSPLILIML